MTHDHFSDNRKSDLLHRLKIVQGHLDKVASMIDEDEYCMDIIHQSYAVQKALEKVDRLILENHLMTCVRESLKNGESEEKVNEILEVFDKDRR